MKTFNNKLFILFVGKPLTGKTTLAKAFASMIKESHATTSSVIYKKLSKLTGCSLEDLEAMPKEIIRPILIALGNKMCEKNPASLGLELFRSGNRIIDGVRRKQELIAIRKSVKTDLKSTLVVVWCFRKGVDKVDNLDFGSDQADIVFEIPKGKTTQATLTKLYYKILMHRS